MVAKLRLRAIGQRHQVVAMLLEDGEPRLQTEFIGT